MKYIIGIDIGTTNTKAVAFTDKGQVLGSAGASYSVFSDASGRHELDPGQLLEAVVTALREVRRKIAAGQGLADEREGAREGLAGGASVREGLAGISFSCAFHSLIAVDHSGMPLTRAMTWADLRPSPQAKALKGSEAGKSIYRHTGVPIHAMSPLCKLLWLKENSPAIFGQAARFISIKEYIWWRLFGKYQVDHSIASATGLLETRKRDWYPESLELAGIGPGQLSAPVPCTHVERVLLPEARQLLEEGMAAEGQGLQGDGGHAGSDGQAGGGLLPEGLPFIIGGGDGSLANLGSSAVRPGETALTIGTSGAIRMTAASPQDDPQERVFSYILSDGLYICGGATNNGGNVIQWYVDKVLGGKEGDEGELNRRIAEADTVPPGCEGLIFLPYLQGERAPVWNADAKGVFFGVRSVHEQRHFMRAILEGISYSLYQIGVSMEETTGPIKHIYASGGWTRSPAWLQLMSDVFRKKIYITGVADASAIGAAIMGLYALGIIADLDAAASLVRVVQTYEPDEARHVVYQANYKIFSQLYSRLKDLM
jgi:gluconokinase